MPRLRQLWVHDLVAVLLVMIASALVFWLLPLPAEARQQFL